MTVASRARAPASGRALPREVRIIGGHWRRHRLPVLERPGLRPTPDRIRETLFNWLGQDLTGWRCLDAFAGSGALGFEAASRGAAEVVMLEADAAVARQLVHIRSRLGAQAVQVQRTDALRWMAACAPQRFELVFLDPPFDARLLPAAVAAAQALVVPGGFIYLESADPWMADDTEGLLPWRQSKAGAVHATLLQRAR